SCPCSLFCPSYGGARDLHSFPTRRSPDLRGKWSKDAGVADQDVEPAPALVERGAQPVELLAISQVQRQERCRAAFLTDLVVDLLDRKSTRLNSSHVKISYAVFCLKKKNQL